MPFQELINLIIVNGHLLLFPIIVIEGPIFTIISGFLSSIHILNLYIVLPIVIIGDITGDIIYYFLGYFGREKMLLKFGKFFGVTKEKIRSLEKHFHNHAGKTLAIGKFSHGVGSIFLFAAGIARVPFWRFLLLDLIPTIPKSILLLLIGFYFGESYNKIKTYLDYTTVSTFVLFALLIVAYISIKKIGKKYNKNLE